MTNLAFEREKENGLFIFYIFGIGDQSVCVCVCVLMHIINTVLGTLNTMADRNWKTIRRFHCFFFNIILTIININNNGVWNLRISSEISPIQAKWQIHLQNSVTRKFQSQLLFKNLLRRIGRRRSLRLGVSARYAYSPIFRWPNSSSYSSSFLLFRFPQKTAQETFQIPLSSSHLLQFQEEIRSPVSAARF